MNRLLAAVLVVPASLVVSALAKGPGRVADAKPEYAAREKKECAFCHKNPKGAGPLNDKGSEYRKNDHKFAADPKGYGEDGAFTTEAAGKAYELVKKAIELGHYSDALKRITEWKAKEKKGAGAQLLLNTERSVDTKGVDLARVARDSVQGGKVPEAAEALIRVETEFKGREASKDIGKVRSEFAKLAGAKEADTAAKLVEPQRLLWLDVQMREIDRKKPEAIKLASDLVTKYPEGPFAEDARKKIRELGGTVPTVPVPATPAPAPPKMGGG